MKRYDVIIVGGGPAGIFAAVELTKATSKILILEKGKKLAERRCPSKEQGTACLGCQPCSV
ncbi:MAG: NAD(P)-binding domain-containing protein, partial [Firmicutes bacterium]|nr:NAD(P)-binding domain-containing protein [Bacillota bacterium]